jgi:hypothetical protein
MNLCRTCKHWSRNADFIGAGVCVNTGMRIKCRVLGMDGAYLTAQNFGCTEHAEGPSEASLLSLVEEEKRTAEFLHWLSGLRLEHLSFQSDKMVL